MKGLDRCSFVEKKKKKKVPTPNRSNHLYKALSFFSFVIDEFNHILKINPYTIMYDIQYCFLGEKLYTGNIIICI